MTDASGLATMRAMKQILMRLPDELGEAIDKRCEQVGLSRNAWLVKALEWAIEQPIRERVVKSKEQL